MSESDKDKARPKGAPRASTEPDTPRPAPGANEYRLQQAVRALDAARVGWLIAQDVNLNVQDGQGMTPLHIAASLGARPIIRALVASERCDYLIRDAEGRYAFELAIEWARDYAVARLLQKKQMQQASAQGVPAYIPRAAANP